jgi:hypothetical protein
MAQVRIGLGGDLDEYGSLPMEARLRALRAELATIDPAARIDFQMGWPSPEDARAALDCGAPFLMFGNLYVVGGGKGRQDALEQLDGDLRFCERSGTIRVICMQIDGDSRQPSIAALVGFFREAWRRADAAGIALHAETHIDRFTYDPRRLLAVDAALRAELGRGLDVCADFSHYAHQLDNTVASNWDAIRAGELVLDPQAPGSHLAAVIARVRSGHLRCAAPNALGRGQGSVQYPIVDPAGDPRQPGASSALRFHGAWREERTRAWKAMYRHAFAHLLARPGEPALFATEFIDVEDEYRMDPYRNVRQNLAALAWAQRCVAELASATASGATA